MGIQNEILIFYEQKQTYDDDKIISSDHRPNFSKGNYELSFGSMLNGKVENTYLWLGGAAYNVISQNEWTVGDYDLTGKPYNFPFLYNIHAGATFTIQEKKRPSKGWSFYLTVNTLYKKQSASEYLETGLFVNAIKEKRSVMGGLSFRGIPFKHSVNEHPMNDALSFCIGGSLPKDNHTFTVLYNFDLTLSTLKTYAPFSHQILLLINTKDNRKEGRIRPLYPSLKLNGC